MRRRSLDRATRGVKTPGDQVREPRPIPIGDSTWLVRASQGNWFVALYVVLGDRLAVIDSGYLPHPADALAPALRSLGMRLDDIDLLLTTHGHADHAGGHREIVERSSATVYLHPSDAHFVEDPSSYRRGSGPHVPKELLTRLDQADRAAVWEATLMESVGGVVRVDHAIEDGETIDLGKGRRIEARHTPGHTAGSVTYVVHPERMAITGDAVQGRGYRAGLPLYDDPDTYAASLDAIAAIEPNGLAMGHAFRTPGSSSGDDPLIGRADIDRTLAESSRFTGVADDIAARVVARGPSSLGEGIAWFIESIPAPFDVTERDLRDVGLNALLTAALHLRRAGFDPMIGPR